MTYKSEDKEKMLVGKIKVDIGALIKNSKDKDKFLKYCDSLVPIEFQHQRTIIGNQRYLCCLYLRNSNAVSWDKKKELLNEIMKDIEIVGFTDALIEVSTLCEMASKDKIMNFRKKGV